MKALASLLAALVTVAVPAAAQQPTPAVGIQPQVVAAQAAQDRTVTFRIFAPVADEVDIYLPTQTPNRYPLAKAADGTWSVTVGPFAPNIYDYSFLIGGARVNSGQVEVTGATVRAYTPRNVPHGSVTLHPYQGAVQNRPRALNVYLPPEYYSGTERRFPVLYLFTGMDHDEWVRVGRLNVVMDNLIADRAAVPMIVVMPNNTTGPTPRPALENAAIMEREMLEEIMPFIERTYRTLPDRNHRAIAGISFGGGTAYTLGMRHLDRFGWVGEFATGAFGGGERTGYAPGYVDYDPDNITPDLYARVTAPGTRPQLLFMSVGEDDPRAPFQRKAYDDFRLNGFEPVFRTYPGGHDWRVFRPAFEDLTRLLFKQD